MGLEVPAPYSTWMRPHIPLHTPSFSVECPGIVQRYL